MFFKIRTNRDAERIAPPVGWYLIIRIAELVDELLQKLELAKW